MMMMAFGFQMKMMKFVESGRGVGEVSCLDIDDFIVRIEIYC